MSNTKKLRTDTCYSIDAFMNASQVALVVKNPPAKAGDEGSVLGVAKSWTRLSDFTFTIYFHALEKEMATHSSVLAWEPGGLQSMGSRRVGHD